MESLEQRVWTDGSIPVVDPILKKLPYVAGCLLRLSFVFLHQDRIYKPAATSRYPFPGVWSLEKANDLVLDGLICGSEKSKVLLDCFTVNTKRN